MMILRAALGRLRASISTRRLEIAWLALGLAAGTAGAAVAGGGDFLPRAPWSPRRVAFTFDDGPHPAFTGRILDQLRRADAKATFFVVGGPVARNPLLVQDILRRGSDVANHTFTHPNLTRIPRGEILDELRRTQELIDEAGARGPRFFRPPGGRFNPEVLASARAAGYRLALWTVLPKDHEGPTEDVVRRRVLSEVSDGAVVLLHSGIESTARALPGILAELKARGYRFVTVRELAEDARPTDPVSVWLEAAVLPPRPALPPEGAVEESEVP